MYEHDQGPEGKDKDDSWFNREEIEDKGDAQQNQNFKIGNLQLALLPSKQSGSPPANVPPESCL